jgi:3-oxoacid CoA-transferase subunit B
MGWTKEHMCRIAAQTELKNGMYVNLGIGMPTAIPDYMPNDMKVVFQSENGMLGMGPFPLAGQEDPDLINAGKQTISELSQSSFFDSAYSFAMIRGGHIDLTILGALQVDENGDLANWTIPGKMVKGMGGAMDLVAGVRRIVILMDHVAKDGSAKLVKKCTLPLTGVKVVHRIITDLGIFDVEDNHLVLVDKADDVSVEEILDKTEASISLESLEDYSKKISSE